MKEVLLNSPLRPNLKKLEKYLSEINKRGWFTNFGPVHNKLQERLQEYLQVENLLLTNNGTTALQIATRALGVDSIVTTPFSFVATTSAFKWQKDDVSFSDIDPGSLNICPSKLESNFNKLGVKDAIVATHVYGNACDVKKLMSLAERYKLKLIFDAAHAFGVKNEAANILSYGDASTLSFHATKVFHSVEGGAIVFKDKEHYEIAKNMINFGIDPTLGVQNIGINGKLNEYQAAVGLVNLDSITETLERRTELFFLYNKLLSPYVQLPGWNSNFCHNGAYMPILLKDKQQLARVQTMLIKNGVQSRNYFSPSLDVIFSPEDGLHCPNSRDVSDRVLCLPMHSYLSFEDVKYVVECVLRSL